MPRLGQKGMSKNHIKDLWNLGVGLKKAQGFEDCVLISEVWLGSFKRLHTD